MTQDVKFDDGLDFVEMVLTFEDIFGIKFPEDAFARAETLGDVHDVVWRHLVPVPSGCKCPTSMSFYRLKAAIGGSPAGNRLRPATVLRSLPGFQLSGLRKALPGWDVTVGPSGVGWMVVVALVLGVNGLLAGVIGPWTILTGLVSLVPAVNLALRLFPARYPPEKTLGDLARNFATRNLRRLRDEGAALTQAFVWQTVVRTAADKLEAETSQLSRQSRLV